MTQSRKRRSSMSPTPGKQSADAPELKKRKLNGTAPSAATSSKQPTAAHRSKARSPEPVASDSSVTLDGDTPPASDKGKAVEKDPLSLELERLRKEVAHKNELLEKREKTVAAVVQTLTCQICLELLNKPYALAPCGHVSCHSCLVSWFTAPHNDHDDDEHNPDVEWYSDSDDYSSVSEEPDFEDNVPPQNADLPNENLALDGPGDGNPPPAVNGVPPPPVAPAHPAYPNSIHRRKTCPHCRCVVEERPVQLYILKDLIGIVHSPDGERNKEEGKDNDKKDPWKGIFRRPSAPGPGPGPGHDGGPGGGHGGGHVGVHGGGNGVLELDDGGINAWTGFPFGDDHDWPDAGLPAPPIIDDDGPLEDYDSDPEHLPPPIVDQEDGVRRCGTCLYEIWHGECTNQECGIVYEDASDVDSVGSGSLSQNGHSHEIAEDGDEDVIAWLPPDPDVDDGYESSFIDDEEHRRHAEEFSVHPWEVEDEDDDDFIPGPSRRLTAGRQETIVISSDEDEDEPGPSTAVSRRGFRQIVDEEEELEVEEGVGSVDEENVAHFINLMHHGYESPSSEAPSAGHSAVVDDGDEENYTGVPYVWEEEHDSEDDYDESGYGEGDDADGYLEEGNEDHEAY